MQLWQMDVMGRVHLAGGTVVKVVTVWVPRTASTSCDQAVFVDQAAGARVSSDAVRLKID